MTVLTPKELVKKTERAKKFTERKELLLGLLKLFRLPMLVALVCFVYLILIFTFVGVVCKNPNYVLLTPWFKLILLYPISVAVSYSIYALSNKLKFNFNKKQ